MAEATVEAPAPAPVAKNANEVTYNFKESRLEQIPIDKIMENVDSLRPVVDKTTVEYRQLADSVARSGVMLPILVRPVVDPVDGTEKYGLIDGLHRYNAAMDAGLKSIPAQIGSLQEADLIEAQIIANVQRIETPPTQLTKGLLKILAANPTLTVGDLCVRINKEPEWFYRRLSLLKLTDEIQSHVNDGTLTLANAFVLAQFPQELQEEHLQAAVTMTAVDFKNRCEGVLKELKKARQEGREANKDVFTPSSKLRPLPQMRDELDLAEKTPESSAVVKAAKEAGVKTLEDAIIFGLKWAINMDPASVDAQKKRWEEEKKNQAEKAEKKKAEKEAKAREKAINGVG